ncbi:hypothetical protein ABEG18_18735 [Alsobacter sp. KACC 23698]|uniref:Uncharacterized protein n=1 Tax=Alsobacter sp. KACC 23698 TaxID=3149229 RepID=A0AAU7JBT8_9HYPH
MATGSKTPDQRPGADSLPAEGAADRPEGRRPQRRDDAGALHPAGPHASPELTDEEKTPGAGALPDVKSGETDPGSG